MWEKLVNCIKGGGSKKKKGCQGVNMADLLMQVPPNQLKQYKIFAKKHEEYKERVRKYPESLPAIDWSYYRQNVRPEFVDWVRTYEAKYDKLHSLFENRHAIVDHKRYFALVDKELEVVQKDISEYKAASNERIKELTERLEYLSTLKPYDQMTMEEFCFARPLLAPDFINKPTFWPHTPEEQMPGPSDPAAAAARHEEEEHEPPEPPKKPPAPETPPAPEKPAAVAAPEKPPADTKTSEETTSSEMVEQASKLAKDLFEKATVLFYILKEKMSVMTKDVQKKAEAAKAARAEAAAKSSDPSSADSDQKTLDSFSERDSKPNICNQTIIRSEEDAGNPEIKARHADLSIQAESSEAEDERIRQKTRDLERRRQKEEQRERDGICQKVSEAQIDSCQSVCEVQPDPCESVKEAAVCEAQPDPCESMKEAAVCEPQPDPCESVKEADVCESQPDPCESLKEAAVCETQPDPCESMKEAAICEAQPDPCESMKEAAVCETQPDPCETMKEATVCETQPDPCESVKEAAVCETQPDPCESLKEADVSETQPDPCESMKEADFCETHPDPCESKKEAAVCETQPDPCESMKEGNVCETQPDPCESKTEAADGEPKPEPCKPKEDDPSKPKSEDTEDSAEPKEPEQVYISISKCSEEVHRKEQEKKTDDKPKESASLTEAIEGRNQKMNRGQQVAAFKDPKGDERTTIDGMPEVGPVYTDPNQIVQLLAEGKKEREAKEARKAKEAQEAKLKAAGIKEAVKPVDYKPVTIYPRREISPKARAPVPQETNKSPEELAKDVHSMAKGAASLLSEASNILDDLKKNKEVRIEVLEQAYINAQRQALEALAEASKAVNAANKLAKRPSDGKGQVRSKDLEALVMAEKHAVVAKMLANRAVALKDEIARVLKDLKKKG
ncbi:hypothetical protein KR038_008571 [Drosophila bunnanda]|nr:hypothetical protein KR038_008571 [Drosophila bunnanda]